MLIEHAGYKAQPSKYLDLFGISWHKQREIIESVFNFKETLVKSCNGVGKTYAAAVAILAFLDLYRPNAKVITTSKSFDAVKFMLWTRVRELYKFVADRFDYADINQTDFQPNKKEHPDWFAVGYNPRIEGEEATAFQGHHADHVLFVIDEAITTPSAIWKAIEGSMMSPGARLLAIYNPTTPDGEVYGMEKEIERKGENSKSNIIHISAFDLFESEEYKAYPDRFEGLTSPEGVKDLIERYGETHPVVMARVFGEYPSQDENAAIDLQAIYNARDRLDDLELGPITEIVYSWDVAGEGADSNVLGRLIVGEKGMRYEQIKRWTAEHDESLDIVIGEILLGTKAPVTTFIVDTIGEGSHVPSMARDRLKGVRIVSFKAGETSEGVPEMKEVKLLNKISEGWYRAHLLLEGKIARGRWLPIAIELNSALEHQLSSRKKYHKMKNKEPLVWFIEPKDDWKKRNKNKSPDEADAFIMAIYGYFNKGRGLGAGLV